MTVEPIVAPPPGHPRFPLIDALRALAALAIVLVHAAIFSGVFTSAPYRGLVAHLDIGVTLFFVLSGFLLYRPFVATRQLGAPGSRLRDYARRRFLRIAPAYWLALTALAVVPGVYGAFSGNWWVYYGLLQNWPVYTSSGGCALDQFKCGLAPTWSLAIEVLFYAALPLYAVALAAVTRRLHTIHWLGIELCALTGLSAVSVLIQSLTLHYTPWLFFSPLGRAWWFALGMGLAGVSVWTQERGAAPRPVRWLSAHPGTVWTTAAALYVVPASVYFDKRPLGAFPLGSHTQYITEYLLFGVICVLLLVPAVFAGSGSGWPRRLLAHRSLSWLGLISYGVFLWHFPILLGLRDLGVVDWWPSMAYPVLVATTLAVTVPCAALSYYALERPLMRRTHGRTGERAGQRAAWSAGRRAST